MVLYRVSHTTRVVSCKQCKSKLVRGELRVDKGQRGAYHAKCVFEAVRRQDGDIQGPGDLIGWDNLPADDQAILQGHIDQFLANSNPVTSTSNTSPPTTSTPQVATHGTKRPIIVLSDSESEPPTPPKSARLLPNLLEGVTIPTGPPRTYDECSVCLDPPVHPVTLPCTHIFCYLCAKGLTRQAGQLASCSLCRKDIPHGYLESAQVLAKASLDLNDTPPLLDDEEEWQWFYEGRNGWWRFEERNNEELEENFSLGKQMFETMICGNLYMIDFQAMEQFQKGFPNRKRKIKRDSRTSFCKGVAGLQKRKWITSD